MKQLTSRDMIARQSVAEVMYGRLQERKYGDLYPTEPRHILAAGIESAGDSCARHLSHGNRGLAYAFARVHAELLASQKRMHANWEAQRQARSTVEVTK